MRYRNFLLGLGLSALMLGSSLVSAQNPEPAAPALEPPVAEEAAVEPPDPAASEAPADEPAKPPVIVEPAVVEDPPVDPPIVVQPPPVVERVQVTAPKSLWIPPADLTMPVERLLWELGFQDSPTVQCTPFTYRFCMEVAIKCHVQRRYADSLAFVRRAIDLRETSGALYLQGLNELALNLCDEAERSVGRFRASATNRADFDWMREKLSSPLTVRWAYLYDAFSNI